MDPGFHSFGRGKVMVGLAGQQRPRCQGYFSTRVGRAWKRAVQSKSPDDAKPKRPAYGFSRHSRTTRAIHSAVILHGILFGLLCTRGGRLIDKIKQLISY
ncbi:hypothetical protein VTK26DRAFT_82 [Humicola hyalothermophila]